MAKFRDPTAERPDRSTEGIHAATTPGDQSDLDTAGSATSVDTNRISALIRGLPRGADGWTDPYAYKAGYDEWVASGGLTEDFLKDFPPEHFINPDPANDWLPEFLRNEGSTPVDPSLAATRSKHVGENYLAPTELTVSGCHPKHVALIGSCMTASLGFDPELCGGCTIDTILVNNAAALPKREPEAIERYDLQIVQIPLRNVIPDELFWHLPYDDIEGHERALEAAMCRLDLQLDTWMAWNRELGLLSFVCNFLAPQHNAMGRLLPRFDIRNPEYFVERLNQRLEQSVRQLPNAYVLDADRISASLGRRYIQDDSVVHISHGAMLPLNGIDTGRMEPVAPMSEHYDVRWAPDFQKCLWNEVVAMFRTVRGTDAVKLVVVDLDDTLWNGVSGDMAELDEQMVEGCPLGLAEALLFLKKRGIMLAILSKNEETRIREIFPKIYRHRLTLEDFAVVEISWRPKVDGMQKILNVTSVRFAEPRRRGSRPLRRVSAAIRVVSI